VKKLTRTWELECSSERFWDVFTDPEYSRALYLEGLHFKDYRVISADPADRKLHLAPKLNVPAPIAKLLGDAFAYEQHGKLDRAAGVWTWKMVQPGGKKGIVSSEGSIRVASTGEGRCRRSDEVNVTGNVFGLGGVIESSVEKELTDSWEAELAFFRRWLATH
jgi:hypothetical protein